MPHLLRSFGLGPAPGPCYFVCGVLWKWPHVQSGAVIHLVVQNSKTKRASAVDLPRVFFLFQLEWLEGGWCVVVHARENKAAITIEDAA
jgi:hypothetical protein